MLVIGRREGQSAVIADGESKITVYVLEIRNNYVKLGFEAPKGLPVHRNEVYDSIKAHGGDLTRKASSG